MYVIPFGLCPPPPRQVQTRLLQASPAFLPALLKLQALAVSIPDIQILDVRYGGADFLVVSIITPIYPPPPQPLATQPQTLEDMVEIMTAQKVEAEKTMESVSAQMESIVSEVGLVELFELPKWQNTK